VFSLDPAAQRPEAASPEPSEPPASRDGLSASAPGGQAAAGSEAEPKCPSCGAYLSTEAVVCINCGYDKRDGKTIKTEIAPGAPPESLGKPRRPRYTVDYSEGARRRVHMTVLGIVLVVGFLLPVVTTKFYPSHGFTTSLAFPNLEGLTSETPWEVVLVLIAPGATGVGMIIAASVIRHPARGVFVCLLPVLPILLLFISEEVQQGAGSFFSDIPAKLQLWSYWVALGVGALLIGTRVRWYRPHEAATYLIGCVGGAACLLHLFLPVFPEEAGHIPLIRIFKMFGQRGMRTLAFGSLVAAACLAASSVICFANSLRSSEDVAKVRAKMAFWLIVGGLAAMVFFLFVSVFEATPESAPARFYVIKFSFMIKSLCWIGAMYLLLPFGVIDLLVGATPPAEARAATSARTAYPFG
jgi:hypothetical protein